MTAGLVPWQEGRLPVLAEADLARWERELGRSVVEHRGRFWSPLAPGFYQPIHLLARLQPAEATRPTRLCWGFRARIEGGAANGSIAVHRLPDPHGYSLDRLSSRRRSQIRASMRKLDIVAVQAPDLLADQGHAVALEAKARTPVLQVQERRAFARWVESHVAPQRALALAALDGPRLLGFSLHRTIDGIAYCDSLFVGDAGMRHDLALTFFHAFACLAAGTPGIDEVVNGQHLRENEALCEFKLGQGLEIVQFPARVSVSMALGAGLRHWNPDKFYRLTGQWTSARSRA